MRTGGTLVRVMSRLGGGAGPVSGHDLIVRAVPGSQGGERAVMAVLVMAERLVGRATPHLGPTTAPGTTGRGSGLAIPRFLFPLQLISLIQTLALS